MSAFVREDFAGPGGWDVGAAMLGITSIAGVEFNREAAAVAVAAGHKRWVADVRSGAVRQYPWPPLWGYIASPPCQTFSTAGNGEGRKHLDHLLRAARLVAYSGLAPEEAVAAEGDAKLDERSVLVLEPLLVIRDHRPTWVAMEQVREVQPIWDAYAEILRHWGYSVWTGVLTAEMYGVPQTRRRAILMASLEREVRPPTPTHSRYYPHAPEKLDPDVQKWVSMAEALGGSYVDLSIRSNYGTGGNPSDRGMRNGDQPAASVTSKVGRNKWVMAGAGRTAVDTSGQRPRELAEPAHTMTGKGAAAWVPRFNDQSGTPFDPDWPSKRPATTVAGREIVQNPGATANRFNGSTKSRNDGVRVTVAEAGILQAFPADYPWSAAGNLTSQYQRVGDAIPPLLARAILAQLTGE